MREATIIISELEKPKSRSIIRCENLQLALPISPDLRMSILRTHNSHIHQLLICPEKSNELLLFRLEHSDLVLVEISAMQEFQRFMLKLWSLIFIVQHNILNAPLFIEIVFVLSEHFRK